MVSDDLAGRTETTPSVGRQATDAARKIVLVTAPSSAEQLPGGLRWCGIGAQTVIAPGEAVHRFIWQPIKAKVALHALLPHGPFSPTERERHRVRSRFGRRR